MIALHAQTAVDRVSKRIEDRSFAMFPPAEYLEALDEVSGALHSDLRLAGQNFDSDRLVVPLSSFTMVQAGVWEFDVPQYVADVMRVEGQSTASSVPIPIPKAHLDEKDASLHFFTDRRPVWIWSQWANTGKLQVRGNFVTVAQVVIWFMRRWPPLHYGNASGGSLNTLIAGTITGPLVHMDDLYTGQRLQITADATTPANVGLIRRITDFDAASRTFTLDTDLAGVPDANTAYGLVVPVPDEHAELLIEEAVNTLLWRSGSIQSAKARYPILARLRESFQRSIRLRDTSDQRRITSSRR